MSMETVAAKAAQDAAKTTVKTVESGLKKAWSILDAAGERQAPSEVLSQKAIRAIQGNGQG